MRVRFKTERVEVEVDGKDTKDVFGQLAGAVEVFSHSTCGACGSKNTAPVVRENSGNMFFEMRCLSCGACLAFGTKKSDGTLFPKRKDKEGNWLDGSGWVKFKRADIGFD